MFYISCQAPPWAGHQNARTLVRACFFEFNPLGAKAFSITLLSFIHTIVIFLIDILGRKNNSFTNTYCLQLFAGCSLLTTFGVFVNALKACCLQYCHLRGNLTSCLEHAKEKNGGSYSELHVEETKCFLNLLPLIVFHLLYKMCIMQVRKGN